MNRKNTLQNLATVSAALVIGIGIAPFASARSFSPSQGAPLKLSEAFQPPDRGAPPRTADGGARGCGSYKPGEKLLTALTPSNHLALTVAEHPTFFWYVPQSQARALEFTLRDEKDEAVIYKTTLPVPTEGGIVSLTLPSASAPALKEGKMYHWYLAMVCNQEDRTGDTVVDGWIERTSPSDELAEQIKNAQPSALPSIYAKAGIWHEAIATLAKLRRNNPNDSTVASRWEELLNSVELGAFTAEPFVEAGEISKQE